MPSISSCLITITTAFRNPNGTEFNWTKLLPEHRERVKKWKVLLATGSFLLITPAALFETAISKLAQFTTKRLSGDAERKRAITAWAESALFSIHWAIVSLFANTFTNDMLVTENNARKCFSQGYYFEYPNESII
jgi:hypothetical protein